MSIIYRCTKCGAEKGGEHHRECPTRIPGIEAKYHAMPGRSERRPLSSYLTSADSWYLKPNDRRAIVAEYDLGIDIARHCARLVGIPLRCNALRWPFNLHLPEWLAYFGSQAQGS